MVNENPLSMVRPRFLRLCSCALSAVLFAGLMPALAQVNMSATGSYFQGFDMLSGSNGQVITWVDGTTVPNWLWQMQGADPNFTIGNGASTAGGRYSFGTSGASDRAMGSLNGGGTGAIAYGMLLRNTSGRTINDIRVYYTGEQWRIGQQFVAQALSVSYLISSTTITQLVPGATSGFTAVPALTFTSPNTTSAVGALDGNQPPNRWFSPESVLPGLSLPDGHYLLVKWEDPEHAGADHGLAIDDVSISWRVPVISMPAPTALGTFSTNGVPSASQSFTVGATGLSAPLVITAPLGFELREQGIGPYATSVSFVQTNGTVSTKTIEVRLSGSVAGNFSDNVVCSSTNAISRNVAVHGCSDGPTSTPCDDGDPCTANDVVRVCGSCAGTYLDTDGDGVCNAQDNCPNVPGQIGSPCDDGNACTYNDVITSACECAGTPDTPPVITAISATPSTVCTNGTSQLQVSTAPQGLVVSISGIILANTSWTFSNANNVVVGSGGPYTFLNSVQTPIANPGPAPYTLFVETQGSFSDDAADYAVLCSGTVVRSGTLQPQQTTTQTGINCNLDPYTFSWSPSTYLNNSAIAAPQAVGVTGSTTYTVTVSTANGCTVQQSIALLVDTNDPDGDGICSTHDNCPNAPGQIGSPCDDGNPCTINDVLNASCQCVGTFQDTDGDGVCDANDSCPAVPGQIGSACNDNDPCTINDVLNASCQCVGTPAPVTVALSASAPSYCTPGPAVVLTATGAATYSWSPAHLLNAPTGSIVEATPALATTFTVIGTNAVGCQDTETIHLGVGWTPSITGISAMPDTVLYGNSVQLQVTGGIPTMHMTIAGADLSATTWTLTDANGNLAASGGPAPGIFTLETPIDTDQPGPYTLYINNTGASTVFFSLQCGGAVVRNGQVSSGSTTTQTNIGCSEAYSYAWSPASGLSNATTAAPLVQNVAATTTYTATITNSTNCTAQQQVTVVMVPIDTDGDGVDDHLDPCPTQASEGTNGNFDPAFGAGGAPNNYINSLCPQPDGRILVGGAFSTYAGASRNRIARIHADGTLDASFVPGTGANELVEEVAMQSDGKIVVVGWFQQFNGHARARIARLHADGTLDQDFNAGADASIRAVAVQADDRIIIAGTFEQCNGTPRRLIARLHTDGSLDASFIPDFIDGPSIEQVIVQPDGKLLVIGNFQQVAGQWRVHIVRLNADGTLDPSFNPGTSTNGSIRMAALQGDGRIIVVGNFLLYDGVQRTYAARINPDGSLDHSFNAGLSIQGDLTGVAIQADGRVIITGSFTSIGGVARQRLARLLANGALDPSFDPGPGLSGTMNALIVQADGRLVVGGGIIYSNGGTVRQWLIRYTNLDLDADGVADASDNCPCHVNADQVIPVWYADADGDGHGDPDVSVVACAQPAGHVASGIDRCPDDPLKTTPGSCGCGTPDTDTDGDGIADCVDSCPDLASAGTNGALDTQFASGAAADNVVMRLALQADGKTIVVGGFANYDGVARTRVARINADGTLDETFNTGTGANNTVQTAAVLPDGKVLIAGWFTNYNGTPCNHIVRLNPDGTLDPSFVGGSNNAILGLAVQPDGKILIVGLFTNSGFQPRNHIARLNTDGTIDMSFDPGTGPNGNVEAVVVQPDGKVVIGGQFTQVAGVSRNRIARLNADGTLDAGFDPGSGANDNVITIAHQADGRIIAAGSFTQFNGAPHGRVVRLNANGSVDATFNSGAGANNQVEGLTCLPDGKILLGGWFSSYNGASTNSIVQLNSDGTRDATFNTGSGANANVRAFAVQPNGEVLIGGGFTAYNGIARNRIAKLTNNDHDGDGIANDVDNCPCIPNPSQNITWFADADGDGFGDPSDELIACEQPVGYVANASDDCPTTPGRQGDSCDDGDPSTTNDVIGADCICAGTTQGISVAIRMFLEGPYDASTGRMRDDLRALGLVPTEEPYTGLGYGFVDGGGESTSTSVLSTTGNDAIVDWVIVQLRDKTNSSVVLHSRAALLQRDGDVVDVDGLSATASTLPTDAYFVAVLHRNHLGCMTAAPVLLGAAPVTIDLTQTATATYGSFARKGIIGNMPTEALWSGDVNFDGTLRYVGQDNDRDPILVSIGGNVPTNTTTGYRQEDVNLDGVVRYVGTDNDRDPILVNIGGSVPTNTRAEQLPE